ncbi:MAG: hypothetical protein IJE68_00700 [Clostridia bacterium]|nr:hypothetical protein [Clostridia bacterium]
MTQETLDLIHASYQQALEKSDNILQIVKNLYAILSDAEVCEEDVKAFDAFIDGLRGCFHTRKKTFIFTNEITYINIVFMYVIIWLNSTQKMCYDINLNARRKSLESDLRKILEKSIEYPHISANIRDRFGLRGILLNDFSSEVSTEYIYKLYDALVGILAGKNRKMRKSFIDWYENNTYIPPSDKATIRDVLDIPFYVDCVKDYISGPKNNGYKTLQFTMGVAVYSEILPGFQLEIQLRSKEMHDIAVSGTASHEKYRNSQELQKVFLVDDFSKLHITGFTSYDSKEDDQDGIHFSKEVFNRRISTTLVP